jgi:hypothetical protein
MAIRARIRRHPHITAMVTFALIFFIWGWLMPWVWHEPRDWATTISMSVVLGLVTYFNRLPQGRVKALILAAISLAALLMYSTEVHAHGIPTDPTERFDFAVVIAIPIVGIALALRTLRKERTAS